MKLEMSFKEIMTLIAIIQIIASVLTNFYVIGMFTWILIALLQIWKEKDAYQEKAE